MEIKRLNEKLIKKIDLLIEPVLTEKSMKTATLSKKNTFTFKVRPSASKEDIIAAVEKVFEEEQLQVEKIRTITTGGSCHDRGKLRRKAGKNLSKKAIITLKSGKVFLGEV